MQKNHKSPKILKKLEHSDPTVNSLLLQLLKFNPNERWSTTEALKMPMFDSVRIKELEQPAPFKIRIPMDEESHIKS
jgi:serine/threonine protein kinase